MTTNKLFVFPTHGHRVTAEAATEAILRDVFQGKKDHLREHILGVMAKSMRELCYRQEWWTQRELHMQDDTAALENLIEQAVAKAYMQIAVEKMLTIQPGADSLPVVPPHWRQEAEDAAVVSVADLRTIL